jgi:uncharacterized secreted protein with C-terminal beta-propeller domain
MKKILGIIAVLFVLLVAGCQYQYDNGQNNVNNGKDNKDNNYVKNNFSSTEYESGEFIKVNSESELKDFFALKTREYLYNDFGMSRSFGGAEISMAMSEESMDSSAKGVSLGGDSASVDYSETNIQELGVDEADIVKTDGKNIYVAADNGFVVFDASNPKDIEKIKTLNIKGARELFITDKYLITFSNDYEPSFDVSEYDFVPYERYDDYTRVLILDKEDDFKKVKEITLSGNYFESRLINDSLYFISQNYVNSPVYPLIRVDDVRIMPEVYIWPDFESLTEYNIGGINLNDLDEIDIKTYMLDSSATVYVSQNNLYLATKSWNWGWYGSNSFEDRIERFEEAVLGLLSNDVQKDIKKLKKDDEYFFNLRNILNKMYNDMSKKEIENFKDEVREALDEYDTKKAQEKDVTNVVKFELDNGKFEEIAKGVFKGSLLNQFSLSEKDGNLRVATTSSYWSREDGRIQSNNVFVLDEDLDVIGSLEKLAEDESVYSARFEDDRLYLVTFRQVDPFFVIDLEDPKNPEVLGYLKLPGFSDYLHKINDNVVVGVGKDTKESEWGGVITTGVKITLFDVSDEENPEELDSYVYGEKWSDSEVLRDHKAFFYDEERQIIAIPLVISKNTDDYKSTDYWRGVYVFEIKDEKELDLVKKIEFSQNDDRYSYRYNQNPKRVFRIEEVLFGMSNEKIMSIDLEEDYEDLQEIEYSLDDYDYEYELPYGEGYKGIEVDSADVE